MRLPRWIAHRGGGALAPENSLSGIRLAARLGYAAVEFDVMLSGDGTPILIHDETLERTTNGVGRVCDTPDSALFALEIAENESIPRLAEAAAVCREYDLLANVEIKPATGFERPTAEVVACQARELWAGAPTPPLISSFSREALAVARDLAPELPRGLLLAEIPDDWQSAIRDLGASTVHCAADALTPAFLVDLHALGIPLLCYTVNSPERAAQLFAQGVSALFTDRLDLFVMETSAYKALHLGG